MDHPHLLYKGQLALVDIYLVRVVWDCEQLRLFILYIYMYHAYYLYCIIMAMKPPLSLKRRVCHS